MTPKKLRVDKNMVKYDLAIGKHPGEIAKVWGVSRQYISSIRQELVKEGTLQRGKPGRPRRKHIIDDRKDLDLFEVKDICEKILSMALKMNKLEFDRAHYKTVYEYVFDLLCQYITEEEKQKVMAMTAHNNWEQSTAFRYPEGMKAIDLLSILEKTEVSDKQLVLQSNLPRRKENESKS